MVVEREETAVERALRAGTKYVTEFAARADTRFNDVSVDVRMRFPDDLGIERLIEDRDRVIHNAWTYFADFAPDPADIRVYFSLARTSTPERPPTE